LAEAGVVGCSSEIGVAGVAKEVSKSCRWNSLLSILVFFQYL
jgi:hypothetical protein